MVRLWMKWEHHDYGDGEYEMIHPSLDKALSDLKENLKWAEEDGGYENYKWSISNHEEGKDV